MSTIKKSKIPLKKYLRFQNPKWRLNNIPNMQEASSICWITSHILQNFPSQESDHWSLTGGFKILEFPHFFNILHLAWADHWCNPWHQHQFPDAFWINPLLFEIDKVGRLDERNQNWILGYESRIGSNNSFLFPPIIVRIKRQLS